MLLLAAPAVGLMVAAGVVSSASGAGVSCQMTGLKPSVGSPNGAAGHIDYLLRFKNVSGHACTVRGYPKVVLLNRAGKQLGSPAAHSTLNKVRTIRLKPGATATASFSVTEAGNYPRSICGKIGRAKRLRVSLNGTKTLAFTSPACTKRGVRYMSVAPVH